MIVIDCTHGSIRLVNGSNIYEGRVEVCVNNHWGTICDDSWGTNDAQVVCRQLGYSTSNATAFNNAYFGQGTGPIHLDDLSCVESSLFSCTYSSTHNCVHSEDAGVSCSSSSSTTSSDSSTFGVIFAVIINFVFFAGCYGFCICLCVCMYHAIKRKAFRQLGNTRSYTYQNTPSYTFQRITSSYPRQQYTSCSIPVVPSTIPTLPTISAAPTVPTVPTVSTAPTVPTAVPTVPTIMPLEPPAYDTSWSQMYNPPNTIELQSMAAGSEDPPPYSEAYKYAEAHQL